MDFRFTEEQDALRELAREILENEISPERLKQSEAGGEFFDREAWARLAESNLLGLAVPEAQGGMGMGFLELCVLLVEVGRTVAPLPVVPTLAYGALPIARFGTEAQRDRWLPPVAKGEILLTAAVGDGPLVSARRDGDAKEKTTTTAKATASCLTRRVRVPFVSSRSMVSRGCACSTTAPVTTSSSCRGWMQFSGSTR